MKGSCAAAEYLLELGADVNARNTTGESPLLCAAKGHGKVFLRMAEILLAARADVNAQDKDGRTPLLHAARHNLDMVKCFLRSGANTDAVTAGRNALFYAVYKGHFAIAKCLIGEGADVNVAELHSGRTPLHKAVTLDMVKLLVENGAELDTVDKEGKTVFATKLKWWGPRTTNAICQYLVQRALCFCQ